MKVRLLTAISGATGSFNAGDDFPCSADEAKRLIEAGFAVAIEKPKQTAAKKRPAKETR